MKKLLAIFSLALLGCNIYAIGPQTNSASITLYSQSGSDFNQYYFNVGSYNDQAFDFDFDVDLGTTAVEFKMTQSSVSGRVTRVYIPAASVTVSGTNVLWSIPRTNLPPVGIYQAELYGTDGGASPAISLARGKINVTESLFSADDDTFTNPVITNYYSFVIKAGDFDQFTGLTGTAGQAWLADGSGSGSWGSASVDPNAIKKDGSVTWEADQSLGDNSLTDIGTLDFDLANADADAVGRLRWDNDEGTLNLGMLGGEVVQQVGFEVYVRARNDTGMTITNGQVVYISGAQGDQVQMSLANASDPDTYALLGLATEDVLDTATGHVTIEGEVRGLDTSAWSEGTELYLSTTDGELTSMIPSGATNAIIKVCIVKRSHITQGILLVHDISPFTLAEEFDGTLRYTVRNTSTNSLAAVGFTAVNDANHFTTMGIAGTGNSVFSNEVSIYYAPGYGEHWQAIDGNEDFVWFSDPTDSHNNSSLTNEIMRLAADGTLTVEGYDVIESARRAIPLLDTMPDDRPTFDYITDGVTVTGIVDTTDLDGDFIVNFDSGKQTFSVPVNLTLANGATNVQQFQYIYVTPAGITNSTTFPSGEYSMLFDLSLLDAAHTQDDGLFTLRRWSNKPSGPNGENRSLAVRNAERLRAEPSAWQSGADLSATVVTNGAAEDDIYITHNAGVAYQLHRQTAGAVTAVDGTQEYHIYNDPDIGFNHITNLNQITQDAQGDAVLENANRWFNVAVLRHIHSGTTNTVDSEIILNLSQDQYVTEDGALNDTAGYLNYTVPVTMRGETIVLGFVTLNRSPTASGTWNVTVTRQQGIPVGSQGGGSTTGADKTEFTDAEFKLIDDVDPTKIMQFEASDITTATTRTITIADRDLDLADPVFDTIIAIGGGVDITTNSVQLQSDDDATAGAGLLLRPNTSTGDAILWSGTTNDFISMRLGVTVPAGNLMELGNSQIDAYKELDMNGNDIVSTPSVTFTTNSTVQFTGTINSTNFVGYLDGTNTYRILFDQ